MIKNPNINLEEEAPESESILNELDLIRFLTIFRKKFFWVVAIFALSLLSAYLYLHFTKVIYEAYSVIKLNEKQENNLLGLNVNNQKNADAELLGEVEIIKSPNTLNEVIKKLNLQLQIYAQGDVNYTERFGYMPFNVECRIINPAFYGRKVFVELVDSSSFKLSFQANFETYNYYRFGENIKTSDYEFTFYLNPEYKDNHKLFFFTFDNLETSYKKLSDELNVRILNIDARTIQISVKNNLPHKALEVVKQIDTVYFHVSLSKKYKAQEQTLDFLSEQLKITEDKLENYESRLESFASKNRSYDIKIDFGKNLIGSEELDESLKKLKKEWEELSKLEKDIMGDPKNLESVISSLSFTGDPKIEPLIQNYLKIKKEMEFLSSSEKDNTFLFANKQNDLKNQHQRILDYVQIKKAFLQDNINYFDYKLKELNNNLNSLPSKETELTRLKRLYSVYEKFYLLLLEKKAEFGITKASTVPEFMVLYPPTLTPDAVSPKKLNIYLTSVGAAFVLSLFILFVSFYMHNTIDNQGELERGTKAAILGVIPKYTKSKMDTSKLVVHLNARSPVSEAMRSIRTSLDFLYKNDKKSKIISITSTISGEGKTFVSVNLAGVIAMSGSKTVIIDLDMRKSKIHFAFDAENDIGMSNLLIGKAKLKDVIKKSAIENFDFICAGPTPPNPSELLISENFNEVLEKLKETYEVIFIDSPPVGLVTDGVIIMQKADVQLYVVRAEYSKKGFEKNINSLMYKNGFKNIGLILNCFDGSMNYGYGYRYGYGYGYGYYSDDQNKKKGFLSSIRNLFNKEETE